MPDCRQIQDVIHLLLFNLLKTNCSQAMFPRFLLFSSHCAFDVSFRPFIRILGLQELASVLFSLGNLASHLHNLRALLSKWRKTRGSHRYPYWWLWLGYSLTGINSWLWSAVFHARDVPLTERLDYFSADAAVAYGLFAAVTRSFGLIRGVVPAVWAMYMLLMYFCHIHYMYAVKFDYGYNMKVCIAMGVLQSAAWGGWVLLTRHSARRLVLLYIVLIHCAALCFEVLDFPPLGGVLDAHALWHACTIPLTYVWYAFMFQDIRQSLRLDETKMSFSD